MQSGKSDVAKVAGYFLKLGFTGFGGPAAHIAMMHREVVVKRKWLDEQEFLDLIGVANLIPGPTSTEMAIHIGWRRAGWIGLVLCGVCFVLPATLIVLARSRGRTSTLGRLLPRARCFMAFSPS